MDGLPLVSQVGASTASCVQLGNELASTLHCLAWSPIALQNIIGILSASRLSSTSLSAAALSAAALSAAALSAAASSSLGIPSKCGPAESVCLRSVEFRCARCMLSFRCLQCLTEVTHPPEVPPC